MISLPDCTLSAVEKRCHAHCNRLEVRVALLNCTSVLAGTGEALRVLGSILELMYVTIGSPLSRFFTGYLIPALVHKCRKQCKCCTGLVYLQALWIHRLLNYLVSGKPFWPWPIRRFRMPSFMELSVNIKTPVLTKVSQEQRDRYFSDEADSTHSTSNCG